MPTSSKAHSSFHIEFTPIRSALLENHENELDVIVHFNAPQSLESHERASLNVSLVLDRSGSMSGKPLNEAKRCAEFVLSRLSPKDHISIVAYDSTVDVVHPSGLASPSAPIKAAISQIDSRGMTNLFDGWSAGVNELLKELKTHEVHRVILLSDGQLNQGLTDSDEIQARCKKAYQTGVTTSTYGLGSGFNEEVMTAMAKAGGGNPYYGESVEDLMEPFIQELDLLGNLYAHTLRATVRPASGVTVECMNDLLKDDHDAYILPDLPYDSENWLGLRLRVSPEAVAREEPLIYISLTGKSVENEGEDKGIEMVQAMQVLPPLPSAAFAVIPASKEVTRYFSELESARIKLKARESARRHDWDAVERLIQSMEKMEQEEWIKESLKEMRELMEERDIEIFSKEAMLSSFKSQSRSKASRHYQSAPVSYHKAKSREGRANKKD